MTNQVPKKATDRRAAVSVSLGKTNCFLHSFFLLRCSHLFSLSQGVSEKDANDGGGDGVGSDANGVEPIAKRENHKELMEKLKVAEDGQKDATTEDRRQHYTEAIDQIRSKIIEV